MDWKTDYAAKRTTAAEAMKYVESGDRVVFAHACGEPLELVDALVARAPELERVEINHMVAMGNGEYCRPEYADAFYHKSLFVGASSRQAVKDGRGDYVPVFFSEIPRLFCEGYLPPDVVLIQVSPPDKHGFCSFGISVDYTKPAAQVAKTVVAQVNPKMPRTHGDSFLHVSEHRRRSSRASRTSSSCSRPPSAPSRRPSASTSPASSRTAHACNSASAASPTPSSSSCTRRTTSASTARCSARASSTSTTRASSPTRASRSIPARWSATFLMGTRRLYDFVDDNPVVNMFPVNIINDPTSSARTTASWPSTPPSRSTSWARSWPTPWAPRSSPASAARWTSCAEPPAAATARRSSPCRATAKKGTVSRIVAALAPGTAVTTMRADVDYIVTEHGVAHLRGLGLRERAEALIEIADPAFRDQIREEAAEVYGVGRLPRHPLTKES